MIPSFISLLLQASTWLWPLVGTQPGDGILAQPQDMIGSERNEAMLFLSAPEGTTVVAPADCTLDFSCLTFMQSLTSNMAYGGSAPTFDGRRAEHKADGGLLEEAMQYVNGSVTLRTADGRKIHILGLRGNVPLKSGQRFRRGEPIGTVAWAYLAFRQPHIALSVSTPQSHADDPMSPFGLPSTYRPPKLLVMPETLTRQQADDDLDFLIRSMHECFPEFRRVVSEETETAYRAHVRQALDAHSARIPISTMFTLVSEAFTTRLLHDSHANLSGFTGIVDNSRFPHLKLGCLGGKLIVTQAQPGWEQYLQCEVASVGGVSAEQLIAEAWLRTSHYDEQIRSVPERQMLRTWQWYVSRREEVQNITFVDGTTVSDTLLTEAQAKPYLPSTENLAVRLHSIDNSCDDYTFRLLSDSVMLLTLGTFELSETQVEEIHDSLSAHLQTPYLYIDVRDNGGGHGWVTTRMASWFIDRPSRPVTSWSQVCSDTTYACFSSCLNYDAQSRPFAGMRRAEQGFISTDSVPHPLQPSAELHYGGQVLLLTDETTQSAAAMLPSILVREGRAQTVGRETGSGYHAMTAVKFAHLVLPHSKIQYRLPLVRFVSDAAVSDRFPDGRGLLPDHEVPLSWEEMFRSEDDLILRRAQELMTGFGR